MPVRGGSRSEAQQLKRTTVGGSLGGPITTSVPEHGTARQTALSQRVVCLSPKMLLCRLWHTLDVVVVEQHHKVPARRVGEARLRVAVSSAGL